MPGTGQPGGNREATLPVFPLGALQPMSRDGFVDVTAAPFYADNSGIGDATAALQHAFDFARWHYYAVYLPVGEYKVTSTLLLRQTTRLMATGDIAGMMPKPGPGEGYAFWTPDFLLDGVSSRYVPHYVRGELRAGTDAGAGNKRATLVLPARTAGFTDPFKATPVVEMHFTNPLGVEEPNAQYNAGFTGINIRIGAGNAGTVGVRLRGAQGSGLEDVEVHFDGGASPDAGLVGVAGGCGSGGAHHSVTVTGGR